MKHKKAGTFLLSVLIILSALSFANTIQAVTLFQTDYSYGIQQANDPTLIQKYTDWKSWFATQTGAGGYWRVRYPEGVGGQANGTASEGIGYAMLLAVWYDDKTFFDGLWNYKVLHSVKNGLMSWLVSSTGTNIDTNSATDADVDIAMALVLAYRRWGTSPTNYNTLASNEIAKLALDFCGTDFHAYPGDYCSCTSNDDTYPSYFTPAWYTEFGIHTGNTTFWNSVKTKAYSMLDSARNDITGLAPEKCTWSGSPVGTEDGYNSSRIPWRYSLDYIWNNDTNSLAQTTLDAGFFTGKSGSACATYNVNGTCNDSTVNGQRVGPAGTSMMIAGKAGELTSFYTSASAEYNDPGFFYNSTLALLSLIQMSGNCPRMFGTPQNTPTPLPGDLFDDCEDANNENNWGGYWYAYSDVGPAPTPGTSYMVPWPDNYSTKVGVAAIPFYMQAPGIAPGSMAYAARMTGNVTAGYTYGFFGMGAGTNADSGYDGGYKSVDVSMYTEVRMYVLAQGAGAGTFKYDIKLKCPKTVTNTADDDYKFTYTTAVGVATVVIPFTSFTQAGWGTAVSRDLVLQNLTDLQFQTSGLPPISGVDVMFDDIMFAPAKTPTQVPTFCVGEPAEDSEDGNNQNLFGGYWSTYKEATSVVWPSEVTYTPFDMSAPGVNDSLYCARMTGTVSGVTSAFVGMATNMNTAATGRDLSMFNAVAFWAKGDGNSYSVKLKASAITNTADNDYKFTFKTTAGEWNQMVVPFSIMTQEKGWGIPVDLNTVITNLQGVQFESRGQSHAVDLSVDDFEFRCSVGWTPTPLPGTETDTPTVTETLTNSPEYSPTVTPTMPPPTETWTDSPVYSPTITRTNTPIVATPSHTNSPDVSIPVDVLIDDCNDGNNGNLLGGYWYTFDDTTDGGLSYTDPLSDNRATLEGKPLEQFTMKGFDHTTNMAGGAAKITGAVQPTAGFIYAFVGMGTNFFEPKTPKDINCCSGVRFYARSTSGTMTTWRMKLGHPQAFTPPKDGENMYGMTFNVTASWTLIQIPFSTLTQQPYWGTTIPLATALTYAEAIQFQSTAPDNTAVPSVALEIDDLTIYNCIGGCMPTPVPTVAIPPTPTITVTPNVPLVEYLIDDCADNNNANLLGGYWYSFDDTDTASHSYVWPMSDKYGVVNAVPTYAFIMSTPGYGGVDYAASMTGTTSNVLGYDFIGMGTNLSEPKSVIPLTGCGGISFYAKSDNPAAMSNFRVKVGAAAAYSCGESGDMYGKEFTVTGSWQMYAMQFTDFTAEGWGVAQCPPQPSRVEALANADSIQFQSTGQGITGINLWIDDLKLVNCYPGTIPDPAASPTDTLPPTSTRTQTPYYSPTYTMTPQPPTATWTESAVYSPTETPVMPTATDTAIVPTATNTPQNTATPTATNTADLSTAVDVLIDDCDDGNNGNLLGGYWYTFCDADNAGDSYVVPIADRWAALAVPTWPAEPFTMNGFDHVTGAPAGAARMTGTTSSLLSWDFIGMGVNFFEPKAPHDISCCGGFRFYARTSSGTMTSFRVKVGHPTAFIPASDGGDMFGKAFTVTGAWQLINIPYTDLTQEGWGTPLVRTAALSVGESIQFQSTSAGVALIDLEVDDLTLYTCVGGCMPTPVDTVPPATPTTPVPTATQTSTPVQVATTTTLEFTKADPVIAYPNPVMIGSDGHVISSPRIEYGVTNKVTMVIFKLFTPAGRLIRQIADFDDHDAGRHVINPGVLTNDVFENLAQGIYYYVVVAEDSAKTSVRSKVGKLVIIKN